MSYDFDHQQPQGLSSGAKTAIGCGAVAFVFVALLCGGIIWGVYLAMDKAQELVEQVVQEIGKQADNFAARFEAEGYERVTGQVVNVTKDIEKPTVYTVQVFQLNANSAADLAVLAQTAEIKGRIDGDLHFLGQTLTIHPDAVITGNLHVQAQMVDNRGTVEGEVLEEELSGLNLPESLQPPGTKPSPGDVIESSDEATPPADASDSAAPTDEAAPADNPDNAAPTTDAPAADAAAPDTEADAPAQEDTTTSDAPAANNN
jgi:hypothetical protein